MSISGVSYQQANQVYQNSQQVKTENRKETGKTASKSDTVKVSEWKPVSEGSSLTPTTKAGYGTVVGNVELSDKAKAYYDKLKNKFHGMDFILVSKDMKSQVEANLNLGLPDGIDVGRQTQASVIDTHAVAIGPTVISTKI